jgi:NADH-quinone oxidoreductase subunit L
MPFATLLSGAVLAGGLPAAEPVGATAATGAAGGALWLILLPALSSAALLVLGRRADRWGHLLGVLAPVASFVIAAAIALQLLGSSTGQRVQVLDLGSWISAGSLDLHAGLRIDPLSVTFALLITFVGALIHVYSIAYMEHDVNRRRFFAYMNLFVAAMLTLVLADSYLLLFFGWEGVGLASYLLIGFWNHEVDATHPGDHVVDGRSALENSVAAKKAFVANRIGDLGMLVAMGLLFAHVGALDFGSVDAAAGSGTLSQGLLTAIGLMLLLAATGKSAQFPLQSWLGDAMAGPTPVSALIHAATMVTAGVYLIVRSQPIFDAAPNARLVVVIIGAITLLYGAIVGSAKDDIKKALAASTMSQIGYMILAAGLGPIGYALAILHLVSHGFFKAGMFLGAGSVMHGMNDSTDMRRFGGLGRNMKVTYFTFMAGWLAILGIPPLSGFFTKDPIIEAAFVAQDGQVWRAWVFGLVAMIGAGITAFYMSRLFFMTFEGKKRWPEDTHPHESPRLMTIPMIVLAVGSVALGGLLAWGSRFTVWLAPVTGTHEHGEPVLPAIAISVLTLLLVVAGTALAWQRYARVAVPVVAPVGSLLTRAARADLYQDKVNDGLLVTPGTYGTRALVFMDGAVVDGAVMGLARGTVAAGDAARRPQTGFVRHYAATMLLGLVVLVVVVLAVQS